MPLKVDWAGVYPAVPTQFNKDFSLDLDTTQKHIQALLDAGIHGLVMLGTIGENASLSREEKVRVLRATVEVAARDPEGRPLLAEHEGLPDPKRHFSFRHSRELRCDWRNGRHDRIDCAARGAIRFRYLRLGHLHRGMLEGAAHRSLGPLVGVLLGEKLGKS